jgi:peptidoglycan/xylan/chitin deacetylase (PgdA/CDA1 family)
MAILKTTKRVILGALKRTGAFSWMRERQWRADRLLILGYHSISFEDEHEWDPSFSMPASVFEARLEMLRSGGYSVLPLHEALSKLYSNALPPKSVAITFDDGLYNFYARAFPILRKYGFPVTLYLTTYYCHNNLPVFNLICSYMLWKRRRTIVVPNPALGLNSPIDLATYSSRCRAWDNISAYTEQNRLTAVQKNELAKAIALHLELDYESIASKRLCHLMTPDEIKEVSRNGVDIQMHTHRHRITMDQSLFEREIYENRSKIQELTGRQAKHFCYPSGVHRRPYLSWLSDQGVTSATTCDPGLAHAKSNPLLLPRILDASHISHIEFESWLTGVSAFIPRNPLLKRLQ